MMTTLVLVVVVASLYFGREIFVPIALSILLSFALAPPVRWLRAVNVPRIAAVLMVVSLAFAFIAAFGTVVAWQVGDLAQRLPAYQRNIEAKIDSFREGPPGGALFGRASQMIRDLGRKIEESQEAEPDSPDAPPPGPAGDAAAAKREALLVEVQQPTPGPIETLQTILVPLISPLATAGIVIVFVIFMLLKREDLRDRVLRLFGSRDLSRTTDALDDAAHRVGHYLLMQLVVNVTYGIPIALGLWLIGLPNPVLWGMLATVLRFVPYIGPIISSVFPLALAIAVDPGWSTFVYVAGLIVFIELISNNAVEPWLYGSSTGLSPVAIIVAAIFWTWLWGPIGLLLSTPLTVCLLVLGQHVPQLKFLDVLFGSDPVLTPSETLYHRLLVGDPDEATERAEDYLNEHSLPGFFDQVALPALAMAEKDRVRRALDEDRLGRVAESFMILVDNLSEYEEHERAAGRGHEADAENALAETAETPQLVPAGAGLVLCAGARGSLDEAAASMLAHLLERRGANARTLPCASLQSARLRELDVGEVTAVVLSYMNPDSLAHARFLIRRLRRRFPGASIIVGFWTFTPEDLARRDPLAATGADRIATSLNIAVDDVVERLTTGTLERREPQLAVAEQPLMLPAAAE